MNSSVILKIFPFYLLIKSTCSTPDVDNKVKIPEAITPDQYQKVDKLLNNQEYIDHELKDQLKSLGKLHSSIGKVTGNDKDSSDKLGYKSLINDDSMIFNASTIDSMEAPVIYLEPPLVLPKEQIKTDKEVESFLKAAGLETESKDLSDDPYKITSIDDAKTSEKVVKSRISKLRTTREEMFKKMRKLSLDIPGVSTASLEFNKLKEGIKRLDENLEEQLKKLTQIEHVKAALINKKGPGSDVEAREEDLEDQEQKMEKDEEYDRESDENEENESEENYEDEI